MKVYMFPGQGSQIKGMGDSLFDEFKDLTDKADEILGYSIRELCLENPNNKLHLTQHTQPALYVVNAFSYYKKLKEFRKKPDFVIGHSLGEYNALLASGGFGFETGLRLVKKRGELMNQASGGAMVAVLGLNEEITKRVLQDNDLTGMDIANVNAQSQIVVSGLKGDIERAQSCFEQAGATYLPLNVSAAFHSRYMQKAKEEFEAFLMEFDFSELTIPVICNVDARPYQHANIATNLANQLRSSVKWLESIHYLMSRGEMEFEELGVGNVLTKLIDKIKTENTPLTKEAGVELKQISESKAWGNQYIEEEDERKAESDLQSDLDKEKEAESMKSIETVFADLSMAEDQNPGRIAYRKEIEEIHKRIEHWNKTYPIGTRVSCEGYDKPFETRTEATILFGHRAAIYMKGYDGYFALDEISPI